MKIKFKPLTVLGLGLPVFAFAISYSNPTQIVKEEPDLLQKVNLHEDYYSKDYLDEPKLKEIYEYNFQHLGLGGLTVDKNTTWNNSRGEIISNDPTIARPIKVAVIDSGFDIYHEDLIKKEYQGVPLDEKNILDATILDPKSARVEGFEAEDENGETYVDVRVKEGILECYDRWTYDEKRDEYYSHGTAVSSCIASVINGKGALGVAPHAKIIGISIDMSLISLHKAIDYAVDAGADVINMSLGMFADSFIDGFGDQQYGNPIATTYFNDVIGKAISKNIAVVASAGNERTNHLSYPASIKGVFGVGALAPKNGFEQSTYTNFNQEGAKRNGIHNTDIVAPGSVIAPNVDSEYRKSTDAPAIANSVYKLTQGTSFSSPLTAGVIALYKGKYPNASLTQIENALFNSSVDIGYKGYDSTFANGKVDVNTFLEDQTEASSVTTNNSQITLTGTKENPYPTYTPNLTFAPNNTTTINKAGFWSSDNPDVCIVHEKTGQIGATGIGDAIVTFTTYSNPNIHTTINVKVTGEVPERINQEFEAEFDIKENDRVMLSNKTRQINVLKTNGPVYFDTKNPEILTVDENGLLTAHNLGTTNIKISCGTKDYEYKVYVAPDNYPTAIKTDIGENVIDIPYGVPLTNGYKDLCKASVVFNDGTIKSDLDIKYDNGISIYKYGLQKGRLAYEEYGIRVETAIYARVISKGSKPFIGSIPYSDTYVEVSDDNHFANDNNTIIVNNIKWRYEIVEGNVDPTNIVYYPSNGIYIPYNMFGANENEVPKKIKLIADQNLQSAIHTIIVGIAAMSADVKVTVDGVPFLCNGNEVATVPPDAFEPFAFTGSPRTGHVEIEISNITGYLAFYYLVVRKGADNYQIWDERHQARDYLKYLYKFNTCSADWTPEMRNEIPYLIQSFNDLLPKAKDEVINKEAYFQEGIYKKSPLEKLKTIVDQYNKTVKGDEVKLELILRSDPITGAIITAYRGDENPTLSAINPMMLIALSSALALVIGTTTLVYYKKRK